MFRTKLQVTHEGGKDWTLSCPLVYQAKWEWIIIRQGFQTDFASIPRGVRWLLDNAGMNSEAAVLHDAVWRESMRPEDSRVDPWHADGLFRRALRQSGSTALARSIMWFAVRITAILHRRFGRPDIPLWKRVSQLLVIFVLAVITIVPTTLVVTGGLAFYWLASWIVSTIWWIGFERSNFGGTLPNLPWPVKGRASSNNSVVEWTLLEVIPMDDPRARALDRRIGPEPRLITTEELDEILVPLTQRAVGV